jgi:hypothetical protein
MKNNILKIVLLSLIMMILSNGKANAYYQQGMQFYAWTPGWTNHAQISDFAPRRDSPALHMVMHGQYLEAKPIIMQDAKNDPNSTSLFVASVQLMDIWEWRAQIQRYEKMNFASLSPIDRFKYGVFVFYTWSEYLKKPADNQILRRSYLILSSAWKDDKDPIIGLSLLECMNQGLIEKDCLQQIKQIENELFLGILGQKAYEEYSKAKKAHWKASPPALNIIPRDRWLQALALVAMSRTKYTEVMQMGDVVNGKIVMRPLPPDPPEITAAQKYFEIWYDQLIAATKNG